MQSRWFLSQFYMDEELNMLIPVCTAYGSGRWFCPSNPATTDDWALVQMITTPIQVEAAIEDPRVLVCPLSFDPAPAPQQVIDTYVDWGATSGMSMGALLATLASREPVFGQTL